MSPDNEVKGLVEVFHGVGQIGVSGVHSYRVTEQPARGFFSTPPLIEPEILYDYLEGPTPFDTPRDKLPKMKKDQAADIIAMVEGILEDHGWARLEFEGTGKGSSHEMYTLTEDMTFVTDHGELEYGQLAQDMRCAMKGITGDGTNPQRGWVFETRKNGQAVVGVHDYETATNYFPVWARPLTTQEKLDAANERMRTLKRLPQELRKDMQANV